MLLSDRDIKAEIASGRVVLEPYDEGMVQPSSIDVRIDRYFRVFENHRYPHIDPAEEQPDLTRVVEPLPKDQIIAELTPDKLLRKTNNGNNEVYLFDNNSSPVLMHEVGRVREITFRHAGGGTGKEIDIDDFDTSR